MNAARTLVHLSDLHMGRPADEAAARVLVQSLLDGAFDHIVITGDITHRGRESELETFERIFAPLLDRVTVIPGNHDRIGDDVSLRIMPRGPVQVWREDGLYLVALNSTGPHNRSPISSHGEITQDALNRVAEAVDAAPRNALVALLLHHHVLPLPEETIAERLSAWLLLPYHAELALGHELVARIRGRCDLVLHGHKHTPATAVIDGDTARPLRIFNAGSSTALGAYRVFTYAYGRLVERPAWHVAPGSRAMIEMPTNEISGRGLLSA